LVDQLTHSTEYVNDHNSRPVFRLSAGWLHLLQLISTASELDYIITVTSSQSLRDSRCFNCCFVEKK